MKKFGKRMAAGGMLLAFLLSSSVGSTVAPVTVAIAAVEKKNPMEVTEAELSGGKVLCVTSDMVTADGTLVIAEGNWDKIVIAKEVMAEQVTLRGVTAKELLVESGTKCVVQVEKATVGALTVVEPQIEKVGYKEICDMLDSGMDATEVVKIYKNYMNTKARLEKSSVTIETRAGAEIQTLTVSGNSRLRLNSGKVAEVKVESGTNDSRLKVTVDGYNGKVSVKQDKVEETNWNIVNLEIKDSNLAELNISGEGTCTVAERGKSTVANVSVSGSTAVQLSVPADKVKVDEKSEKVSLKLYTDVKELSAEGKNTEISVATSAKIDNQENVSSDVKVSVGIKTPGTSSSSSSSSKPKPKPTKAPTPTPDVEEPAVTPAPTPDVEKPTVTPNPTPGTGENDGPSDYPEITPGGDKPTGSNTGGALTPDEEEKEDPTPTPTQTPTPTPTQTPTPTPTLTPTPIPEEDEEEPIPDDGENNEILDWLLWEKEDNGIVITGFEWQVDEDGEELPFDGIVNIPKTIDGIQVTGLRGLGYEEITEIILPEGLEFIEGYALDGTGIRSIFIPASVKEVCDESFLGALYLEEIIVDEDNKYYSSIDGCLYSKDATTLIRVPSGFNQDTFEIPDSVKNLDTYALEDCLIRTIVLSKNVQNFSHDHYYWCNELEYVEVAEDNPYFEDHGEYVLTEDGKTVVFVENTITEFEIPKTVEDVNIPAFYYSDCLPLDSVTLEEGTSNFCIENGMLFNKNKTVLLHCTREAEGTDYEVPDTVTKIGSYAFVMSDFEEIIVPESVQKIETGAFYKCVNLKKLYLDCAIEQITKNMCSGCVALEEVNIPNSVEVIKTGAFEGCMSLEKMIVPDSVVTVESAIFRNCSGLTELVLSNNLTIIQSGLCYGCTSLEEIVIPDKVISIGSRAFANCSALMRMEIPDGIQKLAREFVDDNAGITFITANELAIRYAEKYGHFVEMN